MKPQIIFSTITAAFFICIGQTSFADDQACWNQQRILFESEELEETAHHFGEVLETISNYSHLSIDAETLSEEASHFSEAVEAGEDCHHLQDDFRIVYEAAFALYNGVLAAHNRYHNQHIVTDWNNMVAAYERVRLEVNRTRTERRTEELQNGFDDSRMNLLRAGKAFQIKQLK